ncbi:putative transporter subunit: ATP-binding component of ABC superfamily [Candidatus Terasakiella magnetica]|uniref:Putative transporter subunit: ATP-binding component of ABC superfamily n=1 Tax=Candidatus Terasakiella magnetica TaxID=1867952 RepID=A0A1C3RG20_9PROT|nr:ABC transporter ATP-binding protein [Candidatus Terasakiella magnetica]SCA56162.1 putative transporter subunit: ATP-binding component of ABC superfamily [Candidatus Terasakiella magnetica]
MSDTPALQLQDIHLKLASQAGDVNILKGINLEIHRGETIAIVGPSGSGKSSMMMVIAGLERSTSGRVMISGKDVTNFSEDELALFRRDHIGIVFQDFHLVPTMTALENVSIPLEFANTPNAYVKAKEQLEAVGLGHRLEHYPSQLSGGEQQRVALARAFAAQPDLLLADEPTGNLDGETGEKVMDLLFNRHKAQNNTLLLITHDPKLAEKCDRTIHVQDGRISDHNLKEVAAS